MPMLRQNVDGLENMLHVVGTVITTVISGISKVFRNWLFVFRQLNVLVSGTIIKQISYSIKYGHF